MSTTKAGLLPTVELLRLSREADTFPRSQPRVSSIGYCMRKQVAKCLGMFEPAFPRKYTVWGHALQAFYAAELAKQMVVYNELEVRTSQLGVYCHPDIFVTDTRSSRGIQVKTVGKWGMQKLRVAKPEDIEQAQLEWWFWEQNGAMYGNSYVKSPLEYELLYVERPDVCEENWTDRLCTFPVSWDSTKMLELQDRFDYIANCITLEILPEPKHVKPQYECLECIFKQECFGNKSAVAEEEELIS